MKIKARRRKELDAISGKIGNLVPSLSDPYFPSMLWNVCGGVRLSAPAHGGSGKW